MAKKDKSAADEVINQFAQSTGLNKSKPVNPQPARTPSTRRKTAAAAAGNSAGHAAAGNPKQVLTEFRDDTGLTDQVDFLAAEPLDSDEDLKPQTEFTARQLKFLDIYFTPGQKVSQLDALRRAGYKPKNQNNALATAKKILDKFCAKTDPREIFRRVGLSEQSIAQRLLDIADDPTIAAGTRVQALSIASKCIGLQREQDQGAAGAKIIITGPDDGPKSANSTPTAAPPREVVPIKIVK
jgi:hypothetical protein